MPLTKGAKKLFEWLKEQDAGTIVTRDDICEVGGWKPSSLKTYFGKNKLAPFLQPLAGMRVHLSR